MKDLVSHIAMDRMNNAIRLAKRQVAMKKSFRRYKTNI